MLYRTSRYADPTTTDDEMLIKPDGTQVRTLYRHPQPTGTYSIVYYLWRAGDRLDRVAQQFLGDPQQYWRILDLNPEILDSGQITPGTRIRVPRA